MAFVEIDSHIELIDAGGVIMDLPANQSGKYSFPVIVGIADADPLSTRAARMKIYSQLIRELDASGAHYSAESQRRRSFRSRRREGYGYRS